VRSYRRAIDVVSPLVRMPGGPGGPVDALQVAAKANLALAGVLDGDESQTIGSRRNMSAAGSRRAAGESVKAEVGRLKWKAEVDKNTVASAFRRKEV
jgi:hypothetical protein